MNDITEAYTNIKDLYLKFAKDYLTVSDQNMDVCLQKHTSIYAFFGAVLAHAKDILNDAADLESSGAVQSGGITIWIYCYDVSSVMNKI